MKRSMSVVALVCLALPPALAVTSVDAQVAPGAHAPAPEQGVTFGANTHAAPSGAARPTGGTAPAAGPTGSVPGPQTPKRPGGLLSTLVRLLKGLNDLGIVALITLFVGVGFNVVTLKQAKREARRRRNEEGRHL